MKEEDLKKALNELKEVGMTKLETEAMLEQVFSTPIPTPYFKRNKVFALVMVLVLVFSTGGVTYASNDALPGDILYPVKVRVVEPILDVVNVSPERKVAWSEEKVTRRIKEADALAKEDKLDDKKVEELEKEIRKSSIEFAKAVEDRDEDDEEEKEKRKEEFRKKVEAREFEVKVVYIEKEKNDDEDEDKEEIEKREKKVEQSEKVRKIKDTAIRTLDKEDDDRRDERERGRSEDKNQKDKRTR